MTTLTLELPRLTAFEHAMEQIHSKPERLLEFNSAVAHLLQRLCDQWGDLQIELSDSPSWCLYAGCQSDEQLWELGRCDGESGAPVGYLAPAYLNGYRFGRNSALSHQELRVLDFRSCGGWTERDSSAMEY